MPWWTIGLLGLAACSDPQKQDTTKHPPAPSQPDEVEDCAASQDWLPVTPPLAAGSSATNSYVLPAPHPATECPFYRSAWQNFLIAGQPDTRDGFKGEPAIKSFAVLDDVFKRYVPVSDNLAPPGTPRGTPKRAWLGDIKQAGGREILIDQKGHTLYYGIHVNDAFVQFIKDNNLLTAYDVQNADPNLFLPAGLAEYKTAWQWVDTQDPKNPDPNSDDLKSYIWTTAYVPTLSQGADGTIEEDRDNPKLITVRLLAIHTVSTIPGHPEFVWGSMEHTDADIFKGDSDTKAADGHRNLAPIVPADPTSKKLVNPTLKDPNYQDTVNDPITTEPVASADLMNSPDGYLLYKLSTLVKDSNKAPTDGPSGNLELKADTQTFYVKGTNQAQVAQTSIFRMFPASKSNITSPDDAITSLNSNVQEIFKNAPNFDPSFDRRWHYRLVGAQWMDKPQFFILDSRLQNDANSPLVKDPSNFPKMNQADQRDSLLQMPPDPPAGFDEAAVCASISKDACTALKALANNGSDSGFSILAGEDRMSSTAMESFTQDPGSFFNCFSCHNTQAVAHRGVPFTGSGQIKLLDPKLINVSHVFSQIVLEECMGAENVHPIDNTDMTKQQATCPKPQ